MSKNIFTNDEFKSLFIEKTKKDKLQKHIFE